MYTSKDLRKKYLAMLKLVVGRFKEKVMFHLNRNSSGILSYIHSQKKRNCQGYRDVVQKRKKMARVFFIIPFRSAHKYTTFHLPFCSAHKYTTFHL